jgi:hypothetical protein
MCIYPYLTFPQFPGVVSCIYLWGSYILREGGGIFFFLVTVWGYVFHGKSSIPLFTIRLDLYIRKKLINCYNWSIAWYGAETWTLQKVD